jgi:putative peptidoglycan lipid II flippase
VGRLAAPLLAGLFFSLFIGPLVENAFATTVGVGGVSALAYARKIVETLAAILPFTLGLVLLPYSSEMAAGQDQRELSRTLIGALRVLTLLYLPLTVGLVVLREPFVQLLFERGAFTAVSTQLTAGTLFFYAFALLPFALEVIVVQFHFARQDTLTPVIADLVTFALNVALIPPFMAAFGLGGIALAAAIAKAVKVLALLVLFGRKVPTFRLAHLGPFAAQMALASLATAGALVGLQSLVGSLGVKSLAALGALLVSAAVAGGVVFLGAAYLLRVEEIRGLWQRGRAWCKAWVGDRRRT